MTAEESPKPVLSRKLGCCVIGLITLGALLWFSPLGIVVHLTVGHAWCDWRNRGEFDRHRATYESLLDRVRDLKLPVETTALFRMDPDQSLRPIGPSDRDWEGVIKARRRADGRLTVSVVTCNRGHAGVYGLYYAGGTPEPGEVESAFGAGGHIAPVGPHWWRVFDNSQ